MLAGLKNFLIALFLSLAAWAVIAYFVVGYINSNLIGDDPFNTNPINDQTNTDTTTGEDGLPINAANPGDNEVGSDEFTAIILGVDSGESQHDEKPEADTVILLNINEKTKTLMISSIPCNTKTEAGSYVLRLGAVYSEYGVKTVVDSVWRETGLKADYYCVLDYKSIEKIFKELGTVQYNVPYDMYYKPKPYYIPEESEGSTPNDADDKPEIKLKKGLQNIDGEQAVQLLRYKGYEGYDGYSNGNIDRISIQIDFLKEVIKQKMTFDQLMNAKPLYNAIKSGVVETNMEEKDFELYMETIFSINDYEIKIEIFPGMPSEENGVSFWMPSSRSARNLYNVYRKKY